MKKLCLLVILFSTFVGLVGCGNEAQESGLVSDQKGKYSLYVIGDAQIEEKLEKENNTSSIFRIETEPDYKEAKINTPFLKIKDNKPNYFLFDSKDLKYQTTSYKQLVEYLKNNPNPK